MKNPVLVAVLDEIKKDEAYLELRVEDALDELVLKNLRLGGRYVAARFGEGSNIRIKVWIERLSRGMVFRGTEEAMLPLLWAAETFMSSCPSKSDDAVSYTSSDYTHPFTSALAILHGMGVDRVSAREMSSRLSVDDLADCLKLYREFPGMSFGEFVATVGVRPVKRVA